MLHYQDFSSVKRWIKGRIQAIGIDAGKTSLYEDIEAECEQGRAFLFVAGRGFVVLAPIVDRAKNGVLIWVAHSNQHNTIDTHQSDVEELAKQIKATFLEFWTKRPGFHRVAPRHGYTIDREEDGYTVWRKFL